MAAPLPTRDSVTTIREDGSRPFLFPADTHGRFTLARRVSAVLLIGFYLSLPWIQVGGYPAVFLDLAERRFHLFGLTLAAQDMWLLFFVITGLGFSLVFVTALFGRIWCGWACPHTVFLDQVYRRIERLIDGDAVARRALDAAPFTPLKLLRRTVNNVSRRPSRGPNAMEELTVRAKSEIHGTTTAFKCSPTIVRRGGFSAAALKPFLARAGKKTGFYPAPGGTNRFI